MNQTTSTTKTSDTDTKAVPCQDHEIDKGAIEIIALDYELLHISMPCRRCGAWVAVTAPNPRIAWGEPE